MYCCIFFVLLCAFTVTVCFTVVEARNPLSALEVRNYLQVVSKIPRQVTLTDVTFHHTQPSCTPSEFEIEGEKIGGRWKI